MQTPLAGQGRAELEGRSAGCTRGLCAVWWGLPGEEHGLSSGSSESLEGGEKLWLSSRETDGEG